MAYTSTHSAAGIAVVVGTALISQDLPTAMFVGGIFALLSHDPIDRLGESRYDTQKNTFIREGLAHIVMLLAAFAAQMPWLYLYGIFCGNFMDIWDKMLYLTLFKERLYLIALDFDVWTWKLSRRLTKFFNRQIHLETSLAIFVEECIYVRTDWHCHTRKPNIDLTPLQTKRSVLISTWIVCMITIAIVILRTMNLINF